MARKTANRGSLVGRERHTWQVWLACVVIGLAIAAMVVALVRGIGNGDPRGALTIDPPPSLITPAPQIVPVPDTAPIPSSGSLGAILAPAVSDPALGSFSGRVADAHTGAVLWEARAGDPMTPASTAKLLAATAALLAVPADHRLTTSVVHGSADGELVLVGGGDPTLSAQPAGQPSYYRDAPRLDDLVAQIVASGTTVRRIAVDTGAYSGSNMAQGWSAPDIGDGFIAPIEPVMLDGARLDPLADESPRSATPALDAGRELATRLGLDPGTVGTGSAPSGAARVAAVESAPLRVRLAQLMLLSDNVLAEAVGREVAVAVGREPSFSGAVAAMVQTLRDAGFETGGLEMKDASGLSVDDRVPARLLDDLLTAAAGENKPKLRPLLDYLPVAGATGTLADRYANGERVGAGWVRAKTGTLSTASSLAGVVTDRSGRVLTFALMSNGSSPDASRPALDAIAELLRSCGCE